MTTIFDTQDKPFKPLEKDDEWLYQKIKEHQATGDVRRDFYNEWVAQPPVIETPED